MGLRTTVTHFIPPAPSFYPLDPQKANETSGFFYFFLAGGQSTQHVVLSGEDQPKILGSVDPTNFRDSGPVDG